MVNKSRGDYIKGPLDIAAAIEYGGGTEKAKILVRVMRHSSVTAHIKRTAIII
jgi:hypothetical protein